MSSPITAINFHQLAREIKAWGLELGFQQVGIADTDLSTAEHHFQQWLSAGHHGEMGYMSHHGTKRSRPAELVPGTLKIISVRMDYLPMGADPEEILDTPELAYISRYALGRDYHKLIRNRLQRLAKRIEEQVGPFGYRAFTDSAPVLERPLAIKAGLGWLGKHSNIVNREMGSWFFLGELFTDLPLPVDEEIGDHCGRCEDCIDICPTQAIVAPYQVDARRCISYLTIELHGAIPVELRPLIGNRIYGCDDCLLCCPWNRFASETSTPDFQPRNGLDAADLVELFNWSEAEFLKRLEGSPIRRIGHDRWLRNLAVALGNVPQSSRQIVQALSARLDHPSEMVQEHIHWALAQHHQGTNTP